MRPSRDLSRLQRTLEASLTRLDRETRAALSLPDDNKHTSLVRGAIAIELLTTWANFSRAFFFSLANGTRTAQGQWVGLSARGRFWAVDTAIRAVFATKANAPAGTVWSERDEPKWYVPATLRKCLVATGAAKRMLDNIDAATSTGSRVTTVLPEMRNYFAHKNQSTTRTARQVLSSYNLPSNGRVANSLSRLLPTRPVSLLQDWMDDLRIMATYMVD